METDRNARQLTILVADDEDLVIRAIRRLFEKRGHRVLTAMNAEDAIAVLDGEEVHAVMVDQNMPGSGLTVLEKLHDTPGGFGGVAILMTGGADEGELDGMEEVVRLQKPFRFMEVIPMVEEHFA